MAKTKPGSISEGESTVVRTVAADESASPVNDTNYPPANATTCAAWRTVAIFPRFTGGTNPTATLEILHRTTGGWMIGDRRESLTEGARVIVDVMGRDIFVRVYGLTGTPTEVNVHCAGWEPFKYDGGRGA